MAALFPALYDAIDRNPNKSLRLKPAAVTATEDLDNTWDRFVLKPLDPPGPVSFLYSLTDILYAQGGTTLRKQMIREHVLTLQERCDKELKGRRWPRKKIHDLLGAQCGVHLPERSALLEEALAELFGCQLVVLDRAQKKIQFAPPDPRCWTSERPTYVADLDYRWIFEPKESFSLLPWLTGLEDASWSITWPTAEGKMEDIKSAVLDRNLVAHTAPGSAGKVKKDDWARVLGRVQALEALRGLEMTPP